MACLPAPASAQAAARLRASCGAPCCTPVPVLAVLTATALSPPRPACREWQSSAVRERPQEFGSATFLVKGAPRAERTFSFPVLCNCATTGNLSAQLLLGSCWCFRTAGVPLVRAFTRYLCFFVRAAASPPCIPLLALPNGPGADHPPLDYVALCLVARDAHADLLEWVNHHLRWVGEGGGRSGQAARQRLQRMAPTPMRKPQPLLAQSRSSTALPAPRCSGPAAFAGWAWARCTCGTTPASRRWRGWSR